MRLICRRNLTTDVRSKYSSAFFAAFSGGDLLVRTIGRKLLLSRCGGLHELN